MDERDLELEYLRFFYENVDLGENEDDIKTFINSQFRASGMIVPKEYDV
jgi:hypothetical protein